MKIKFFFLLLILNQILLCPNGDERCIRCGGDTCLECLDSYPNNSGLCISPQKKIENCLVYLDEENCEECKFGYKITNGACVTIQLANCVKEDFNGNCLICNKGFKSENGACFEENCEITNCGLCRDFGKKEICVLCHENFVLLNYEEEGEILNKCVHENGRTMFCEIARFNDRRQCVKCNVNYYYSEGTCIRSNEYYFEDVFIVESIGLVFFFRFLIILFSVFYF